MILFHLMNILIHKIGENLIIYVIFVSIEKEYHTKHYERPRLIDDDHNDFVKSLLFLVQNTITSF